MQVPALSLSLCLCLYLIYAVCPQGGDGFFNEILNGFLLSRHLAHYPPRPSDIIDFAQAEGNYPNEAITENVNGSEDQAPLLSSAKYGGLGLSTSRMYFGKHFFSNENHRAHLIMFLFSVLFLEFMLIY